MLHLFAILLCLVSSLLAQDAVPSFRIETFAGGHVLADGGPAITAILSSCERVFAAPDGSLYIADTGHHRVRRVSPSGIISTVAGNGFGGFSGDDGPGSEARLNTPRGLALDGAGNLYIADSGNRRIRRLSPAGIITTVPGTANISSTYAPRSIAVDTGGNLYIADTPNHRVLRQSPGGTPEVYLTGLSSPNSVFVDAAGALYVADTGHHAIVRVTGAGPAVIAGGSGLAGFGGDGTVATSDRARLNLPTDVAVTRIGEVYIADSGNGRIRRISPSPTGEYYLSTVAGGGSGTNRFTTSDPLQASIGVRGVAVAGQTVWVADPTYHKIHKLEGGVIATVAGVRHDYGDGGPAASASLSQPYAIAFDSQGTLLITDTGNHKIRAVDTRGIVRTIAGTGLSGGPADGVAPTISPLASPVGLTADTNGMIYVGDTGNSRLRRLREGIDIVSIAGNAGPGNLGDGLAATQAQVRDVRGIAIDAAGNIYLSDATNNRLRRITPGGLIEKWAGTGVAGLGDEGVHAYSALFRGPETLAFGPDGSLYIADTDNHRIRRIRPDGTTETVAGTGQAGYTNEGGAAKDARLRTPSGIAFDASGNMLIADTGNHRIRMIDSSGTIRTLAGKGTSGYSGEGGPALAAELSGPTSVAQGPDGNIYIADRNNDRIRRLVPEAYGLRFFSVSGGGQSGLPGADLPSPLVVRLMRGPTPVEGVSVVFRVLSGSATLSSTSVTTGADGTASTRVKFGTRLGPVVITAVAEAVLPVQFELSVTNQTTPPPVEPSGPRPRIAAGGVVGAGLSVPQVAHLAPLGLYTVFGTEFTQEGNGGPVGAGDISNNQLPVRFRGVCVEAGATLAPLVQVYPTQITFQAPALSPGMRVNVRVIRNCREAGESASDPEPVEVRAASPEFFFFVQNRDGSNPVAAVDAVTGDRIGPPGLLAGATFRPARPGDILTVFATGFGLTNPYLFPGEIPAGAARASGVVEARLGALTITGDDILYAGVTPGYTGLFQINLRIPAESPDGDLPLQVWVGGVPTPQGAYLTIRK